MNGITIIRIWNYNIKIDQDATEKLIAELRLLVKWKNKKFIKEPIYKRLTINGINPPIVRSKIHT